MTNVHHILPIGGVTTKNPSTLQTFDQENEKMHAFTLVEVLTYPLNINQTNQQIWLSAANRIASFPHILLTISKVTYMSANSFQSIEY